MADDQPAQPGTDSSSGPKLFDRVRAAIRLRHYSRRTEESYVAWIRRFILFHGKQHPSELGGKEVAAFLSHLALRQHVGASTQNQALSALVFLHRHVLRRDLGVLEGLVWAKRPSRLPVVLTRDEVAALLGQLSGVMWVIATLLYGSGLRLSECLDLRVKDIDVEGNQVVLRGGKGGKDRVTPLPAVVKAPLARHLERVRAQHGRDVAQGFGRVVLPDAIAARYPNAATSWSWQFVFPAARICWDQRLTAVAVQTAPLRTRRAVSACWHPGGCWRRGLTTWRFLWRWRCRDRQWF